MATYIASGIEVHFLTKDVFNYKKSSFSRRRRRRNFR